MLAVRALTTWVVSLAGCAIAAAQPLAAPSVPGDFDLDWAVDAADFALLEGCLAGPWPAGPDCADHDLTGDGAVDLADYAALQRAFTDTLVLTFQIADDGDDGTEVNRWLWHPNGFWWTGLNRMGVSETESYDLGLRFQVPQLRRGETVAFARLALPATDHGHVERLVELRIVGLDLDTVPNFCYWRPSQLPKTEAALDWKTAFNWPHTGDDPNGLPLRRYSPDLTPIINEILGRPNWGQGPGGPTLGLVVENLTAGGSNFLTSRDYAYITLPYQGIVAAELEIYRTLRATFVGTELLGRPTDHSVTLHALALVNLEAYVTWQAVEGGGAGSTPPHVYPAGVPIEITLDALSADRAYWYQLHYRRPGSGEYESGPQRGFRTQRPPGATFTFVVQADSHLGEQRVSGNVAGPALYRTALRNMWADQPDFLIDLGDTFASEIYSARDVVDFEEAVERHLWQRPCLGLVCHSAPFFIALGNHEGEQGWRLDGTPANVAIWATGARKLIYPLPAPDNFYTGNVDIVPFCGLREDYYAWHWGPALFVVLDPFWYTTVKPHGQPHGPPGSEDNWDWTLGEEQYEWLRATLNASTAPFKFVFAHHVTGGVNTYARGGVEAASHELGGTGSFEWGGEDPTGAFTFAQHRPSWALPIHQVLAEAGVSIFFHGHDHVFAHQELDGVVYQECPQPSDAGYGLGYAGDGHYYGGVVLPNSGHLRVTVTPQSTLVEYVRAYRPGDGPNGEVTYTYTVPARTR